MSFEDIFVNFAFQRSKLISNYRYVKYSNKRINSMYKYHQKIRLIIIVIYDWILFYYLLIDFCLSSSWTMNDMKLHKCKQNNTKNTNPGPGEPKGLVGNYPSPFLTFGTKIPIRSSVYAQNISNIACPHLIWNFSTGPVHRSTGKMNIIMVNTHIQIVSHESL